MNPIMKVTDDVKNAEATEKTRGSDMVAEGTMAGYISRTNVTREVCAFLFFSLPICLFRFSDSIFGPISTGTTHHRHYCQSSNQFQTQICVI